MNKLLQAPLRPIDMGTSATNMYAFKVYVGGKRMILAANDWTLRLGKLSYEDVEWILSNSFHLLVDRPMWRDALPVA
jgi:hypothetical protein